MKYILILACFMSISSCSTEDSSFTAMTYNIRYANQGDGENRWELRKEWLAGQVLFHEPDILGIQEGLYHQVLYLDSALNKYRFVGVGRDDGKTRGEYSALFYKADKFEVMASGTFWLSPTPDQISVGWDAAMERICTWARLRIKSSGTEILVFNTHFDHIGNEARSNSAQLLVSKMAEQGDDVPAILMGDLNLPPDSEPIRFLGQNLLDSYDATDIRTGPGGTFNGFRTNQPPGNRIDYIFVSGGIKVNKYACFADPEDLRYPSDHFPVFIEFNIHKNGEEE